MKYQRKHKDAGSPFRGVCWRWQNSKWVAKIWANGKSTHIGSFGTELAAARAYDQEAWSIWHDFTRLNFPAEYQDPQLRHSESTPPQGFCHLMGSEGATMARVNLTLSRSPAPGAVPLSMIPNLDPETCEQDGCSKPVHRRYWCRMHYARWQRHGDPDVVLPRGRKPSRGKRTTRSPELNSWRGLIRRTTNPDDKAWPYYGGRGITACAGWTGPDGFQNFLNDVGERPDPKNLYSIDRRDNDGGYWCGHCDECLVNGWPANCRWTTWDVQIHNRRVWGSSKYRGVCWDKAAGKWRAIIWNNDTGKSEYLGLHDVEEDAKAAYDVRLQELLKENT